MGWRERRRRLLAAVAALLVLSAALTVVLVAGGGGRRAASSTSTTSGGTTPASTSSTATTPPSTTTSAPAPAGPAPVGPSAQPPAPGPQQFGASVNWLLETPYFKPPQINALLEELRQAGGTLGRTDALWEASEPAPPANGTHNYNWEFDDGIAAALALHGVRWFPVIDYTAPWDQSIAGQDHSPPRTPADYAAYAGAFAARYGPGGAFWSAHPNIPALPVQTIEIWNEPDSPAFWNPQPSAAAYDDLYLRARDAILAASPAMRVIVGGLTNPKVFLPEMLAARPDMLGHIDGVGIHPYGNDPRGVANAVAAARQALRSIRMESTPLYVTEFGWTTSPPGTHNYAPERLRPGYIQIALALLGHVDCGLAATLAYTWVTPRLDPSNREQWFGLQSPDGSSSADGAAFAAGVRVASAPRAAIPLCSRAP